MSIEHDINALYLCGDCGSFVSDLDDHARVCPFGRETPPKYVTADEVRRIVGEELEKWERETR